MPADEFRGGMHDDIRAVRQRLHQIRRRHRIVDDQRQAVLMGDGRHCRDIQCVQFRIADGFGIDRPGLRRDRPAEILRVGRVHEPDLNAQLGEGVVKERVGAAVQTRRGYDLIAAVRQRE